MKPLIAVLGGDGIGPEVTEVALSVLEACLPFRAEEGLIGGAAMDATGDPLPEATLVLCRRSRAVFLGAVGGPKWEGSPRPEAGLLRLRQALGLRVNLRRARYLGLPTPLAPRLASQADILVVRDLLGGVYFGEPRGSTEREAFNTWRQSAEQVEAVAHEAFRQARVRWRRVTSVDKANVLEASRLWRSVVSDVARQYRDVELEHRYVDAVSFELLQDPRRFDVIVADNLFGDILSDEIAAVAGSIGLLPSASLGDGPPLFEPVHGAAPDIAGRGVANPTAAILSVALLLKHALNRPDLARRVETAVTRALHEVATPDVGGGATTAEFTGVVLDGLSRGARAHHAADEAEASYGWGVCALKDAAAPAGGLHPLHSRATVYQAPTRGCLCGRPGPCDERHGPILGPPFAFGDLAANVSSARIVPPDVRVFAPRLGELRPLIPAVASRGNRRTHELGGDHGAVGPVEPLLQVIHPVGVDVSGQRHGATGGAFADGPQEPVAGRGVARPRVHREVHRLPWA